MSNLSPAVDHIVARLSREPVPLEVLLSALERYPGSFRGRVPLSVLKGLPIKILESVAPQVGCVLSWKCEGEDLLEILKGGEVSRWIGSCTTPGEELEAWALRNPEMDLVRSAFLRWCTVRVLPHWRAWREPEVVVVEWLLTGDESKRAEAARVAWDAAYRDAWDAYWAAHWAASRAARAAYWDASRAAYSAAEQDKQRIQLAKMLLEAADGCREWIWVEKEVCDV